MRFNPSLKTIIIHLKQIYSGMKKTDQTLSAHMKKHNLNCKSIKHMRLFVLLGVEGSGHHMFQTAYLMAKINVINELQEYFNFETPVNKLKVKNTIQKIFEGKSGDYMLARGIRTLENYESEPPITRKSIGVGIF